ncbi:MAG: DUF1924 domain-containing protein [Dechloromonas sp.]|nr:DUF1924 domain-containing protein [Dechloromonas sp.]
MKKLLAIASLVALSAQAATPAQIQGSYTAEAQNSQRAFTPSAQRGAELFRQNFNQQADMPSCTSCHTNDPRQEGKHAVTGKRIRPLAVVANPERFSDPAKVEKWFGRNCKEVVGRACSAGEKADFVAYMSEVR